MGNLATPRSIQVESGGLGAVTAHYSEAATQTFQAGDLLEMSTADPNLVRVYTQGSTVRPIGVALHVASGTTGTDVAVALWLSPNQFMLPISTSAAGAQATGTLETSQIGRRYGVNRDDNGRPHVDTALTAVPNCEVIQLIDADATVNGRVKVVPIGI